MIDRSTFSIAVVGAGLMGHGIAQEFAQHGFRVRIFESDTIQRETVRRRIETNLNLLAAQGVIPPEDVAATLSRVRVFDVLETAVAEADLVVEAVFEDLELKQSIFRQLDEMCPPEVILASNSSSFTPSQYAKGTSRPERIVGTHYFNPPYLVPLVEVVRGEATAKETVEKIVFLLRDIGKKVAIVRKESPGFIANRIQVALFREAFNVVEQGIATPEEVDLAIKNSFGRRLGIMGPFEQSDIIGADLKLSIYNALVPHISHSREPSPLLEEKVRKGELGMKTGRGFYPWTEQSIQSMNERLRKWLVGVNRLEADLLSSPSTTEEGKPEDEGEEG